MLIHAINLNILIIIRSKQKQSQKNSKTLCGISSNKTQSQSTVQFNNISSNHLYPKIIFRFIKKHKYYLCRSKFDENNLWLMSILYLYSTTLRPTDISLSYNSNPQSQKQFSKTGSKQLRNLISFTNINH